MKPILKTLLLILSISLLVNCKKDKEKPPPDITTLEATEITATTAICGGELVDYRDGLAMGICWGTNQNPTVNPFFIPAWPEKRFL